MADNAPGDVHPNIVEIAEHADVRPHDEISPSDEKKDAYFDDEKRGQLGYLNDLEHAAVTDEAYVPEDINSGKPFTVEELPIEEGSGLTIRSLIVGSCLGSIVAASNIYLGLKTGFTFAPSLFGAILGYAILKAMTKMLPLAWGGAPFGPRENCTVQTAATAAGGLTGMFVAAVPAMYQLGVLGTSPKADFGRLFTFTLVSAYYGVFFAIPLRKFYILKMHLVFPTPTATAFTIRSLHTIGGAVAARKKTYALLISFFGALTFVVVNQYASGILMDWHIFYWLYKWGWTNAHVVDDWGWYIELTPAFFGAGMLSGMNASFSFIFGSVLLWAIIGPSLIQTGQAAGVVLQEIPGHMPAMSYYSMKVKIDNLNAASPRYWGLWPGVFMMMVYSFTELGCNAPTIYRGIRGAALEMYDLLCRRPVRQFEGEIEDPAANEDQVPHWAWLSGLAVSVVFTVLVCALQFHMNAGNVILAIVLAFLFAFIGVQAAGATDVNPLSAVAKASQLIVGGALRGQGVTGNAALLENLLAGSIASSAAAHAVDMVGDLKTGHLLRAKPKTQFWAQCFGSIIAVPLAVGLYILFVQAYPCINDTTIDTCPFTAPSVSAWKAVATAVVSPKLPISLSSGMTAIGFGILSFAIVVSKYTWIPSRYHAYIPNMNAVGLGFIVPQTYIPIAMCIGAVTALFWSKKRPQNYDMYAFAVAAGCIAGEGLGGVVNAVLTIAGVSGADKGTLVGVPNWG